MATAAEIVVLIDAAIVTCLADGVASLSIGGRMLTYSSLEDLRKLRQTYAILAAAAARVAAGAPGFRLLTIEPVRPT